MVMKIRISMLMKTIPFLLLLMIQVSVKAQSNGVIFECIKKEVSATNQELVDVMVKVKNDRNAIINANLDVTMGPNLQLVSKNRQAVSLMPGDSVFLSVKVFVGQKAESGMVHSINIVLIDVEKNILGKAHCSLQIQIKKNVNLFAMLSNILLESNTDSIRIPVRVSNTGNTAQKITIISRYPSAIDGGDFHTSMQFVIPASKDTLLTFIKAVNGRMFPSEGFDVNITGLYANGELLGMAYIRIQNARNNRYYRDQSFNDSYDNNAISLSSQAMFAANQSYVLAGRGLVDLPDGKIGYSLDITSYKNNAYSPTMVRNTYLSYEARNMGLRIGNISKNLDFNLNGRGGSFFISDTAKHNLYEAGYINSNANLLGRGYQSFFRTGEAAWASFTHNGKKWQLSSSALYELNPMLGALSTIVANELNFGLGDFRYSFILNAGRTNEYENRLNSKYSYATGVGVYGSIGKLIINSTNYISSGYYPGTRRGALNFSERVTWTRQTGNVWSSLEYYKYTPKYFNNTLLFDPSYSSFRAEVGLSEKILKSVIFSIAPYFNMESNNSFQFQGMDSKHSFLRSWNLLSTVNITLSSLQFLSINAEGGVYNSSIDEVNRFHFRTSSNYRYGVFNLMTSIQTGVFYMGEAINNYIRKTEANYVINVTPSIRTNFFRNKLRTETGISYSSNRLSGKSWMLMGRTEYDLMQQTSLFIAVNHNRYSFIGGQYNSSVLEVGLTKKMRSARIGSKNSSLEIFVFKDMNQNGVYDKGDSVAVNQLIYVNDDVFLSKGDGAVIYKNLPPGYYRISLPKLKDWYAAEQRINFRKNERIEIPLQKTGTIKGSISYSSNEFSYEIGQQLEGIIITAASENGQIYNTRTNANGHYVFFMPIGKYNISVNQENLPVEVECKNNGQETEILSGGVRLVDLLLNVRQRKIETKRFLSPSLRK